MLNILSADDDDTTRRIVKRLLTEWGHSVVLCEDGATALDRLRVDNSIDVAILDWNMPGVTGVDLCKLRGEFAAPFVYLIILSGLIERDTIIDALHSGAHDVLLKPVDAKLLKSRLEVATRLIEEKHTLLEVNRVISERADEMERLATQRAAQLAHADRMQSLGVMSAGIAHEINNPLSFISGNIQSVQRFWSDLDALSHATCADPNERDRKLQFVKEEIPKALESAMNGVRRLTTIVSGLKRFSGTHITDRHSFSLDGCIDQALEFLRFSNLKNVRVTRFPSKTALEIFGNNTEIQQVIINIIVNACHALSNTVTPHIELVTTDHGTFAELLVGDNGPGIPEEKLSRIWDPFFTTKPVGKGTGLGLSISLGIIKDHGGTIEVHNRREGGAAFCISLPLYKPASTQESRQ